MRIRLAYGKTALQIELRDEWNAEVIEPKFVPGLPNPKTALTQALRAPIASPPLGELVKPGHKVGIVFNDITRPTPNHLIIPAVLAELTGVPRENITLFNALGTHRRNTEAELREMLGDRLFEGYHVIQNDAFDRSTQVQIGTTKRGNDLWLNRAFVECDVKILTGFIEPHFFAGFSGGGKAIMPGMAGQQTVLGNHNAEMIAHPQSTWGVSWGNPIWEEIREAALKIENTFLVNVTLNRNHEITAVFAGDFDAAHAQGCRFVKDTAMVPVEQPFDIVITSNSGYPLDLNLYQTVKGMCAAAQIVREHGAIIVAADCWDGIPDHGLYGQLVREEDTPDALLKTITTSAVTRQDQWQAQIQAQIQLKADVYVRSENLSDDQIEAALLKPCRSIEQTVEKLMNSHGHEPRICVLPEGPQTVPYVRN